MKADTIKKSKITADANIMEAFKIKYWWQQGLGWWRILVKCALEWIRNQGSLQLHWEFEPAFEHNHKNKENIQGR